MKQVNFLLILIFISAFAGCKPKVEENEPTSQNNRPSAFQKKDSVKKETTIPDISPDNGENVLFYPTGQIKIKGPKKEGKREGHWQSWYPDGTLWSECDYKAGIKEGRIVTYYENGKKRYEGSYINNKESGTWKFYHENGELAQTVDYDNTK